MKPLLIWTFTNGSANTTLGQAPTTKTLDLAIKAKNKLGVDTIVATSGMLILLFPCRLAK